MEVERRGGGKEDRGRKQREIRKLKVETRGGDTVGKIVVERRVGVQEDEG